ncbi:MAG TPA: hypothetical protein GXX51_01020 [Firmicutes bacterium]|nr:hypothetical protein [Bacillota bacterium]
MRRFLGRVLAMMFVIALSSILLGMYAPNIVRAGTWNKHFYGIKSVRVSVAVLSKEESINTLENPVFRKMLEGAVAGKLNSYLPEIEFIPQDEILDEATYDGSLFLTLTLGSVTDGGYKVLSATGSLNRRIIIEYPGGRTEEVWRNAWFANQEDIMYGDSESVYRPSETERDPWIFSIFHFFVNKFLGDYQDAAIEAGHYKYYSPQ